MRELSDTELDQVTGGAKNIPDAENMAPDTGGGDRSDPPRAGKKGGGGQNNPSPFRDLIEKDPYRYMPAPKETRKIPSQRF